MGNDLVESLVLGDEAVTAARLAGDGYTLAVAYKNLGEVARVARDDAGATPIDEQDYLLRKELGNASRCPLVNLGKTSTARRR